MATLATSRLLLLPLSRTMIATRLRSDDFSVDCELLDGVAPVHFGPEWPGDTAAHFPDFLRYLGDAAYVEGAFVAVERTTMEAIGHVGGSGAVDDRGSLEIGYAVTRSRRGSGFATEAVALLTGHLLGRPGIRRVTARTEAGNVASQRVLRANGFRRSTDAPSLGDGLLGWVRERSDEDRRLRGPSTYRRETGVRLSAPTGRIPRDL